MEENTEYSSYVSVKYNFSKDDVEQNKRALTEGCGSWVPNTRGTRGTTKSVCNDYVYNPFIETVNGGAGITPGTEVTTAPAYQNAKITLPLHCGVFGENKKVFPNLLTNGIYIELVLAGNRNLFRQCDGALLTRRIPLNPRFRGKAAVGTDWGNDGNTDNFYITYDNNQKFPQNCPLVVGEKFGMYNQLTGVSLEKDEMIVETVNHDADYLVITTSVNVNNDTGADISVDDEWFLYSRSLSGAADGSTFNPKCTLSNVELIVHQIDMGAEYENRMMKKVKEGGVVRFDIPSVSVQRYSTLKSEVQASVPLHLEYARAKGIICMPTDASLYTCQKQTSATGTYVITTDADGFVEDGEILSNRTGIEGCSNGLTNYSFFLNGKMVPSRPISTKKVSNKKGGIDAHYLMELEKSLVSFGISPKSFEYYNRNFIIGRMLTLGENAVFDGRGRTCRLDLKYEGTTDKVDEPSVNLLWKIFVSHLRTLTIKGDTIAVEI